MSNAAEEEVSEEAELELRKKDLERQQRMLRDIQVNEKQRQGKKTPRDMKKEINLVATQIDGNEQTEDHGSITPRISKSEMKQAQKEAMKTNMKGIDKKDIDKLRERDYKFCTEIEVVGVERWMFFFHYNFSPKCIIDSYVNHGLFSRDNENSRLIFSSKRT
ncbi:hypothetical protein AKO1_001069 [Acrasis kona]|uniref:Uncharacterized protein n=1 Tax=Acrasis kona TaxID=1008807 RepID=A0AAW2ZF32_9EUKA